MIHRRTLLLGTAGLVASSLITGCSPSADALRITLLEGALPPEVLKQFRKQQPTPVTFKTLAQMPRIFQQLQRWQQTPAQAKTFWRRLLPGGDAEPIPAADDLVSLGDYWLESAIAQDLIEPLILPDETWAALPVQWQQFVYRDRQGQSANLDDTAGEFWAAPYKVQSLVVVYRESQFPDDSAFQSWEDLLIPELRQSIALPDHPNLAIALLQKIQTGRFNASFDSTVNSDASTPKLVEQLRQQLKGPFRALNQQVKTYDAQTALKALVNEDVQVVVAWSGDVVTALDRYRDLRAVVPSEGSLLSADMWVQPKGTALSEAAQQWIAFCWQTDVAIQLSRSSRGLSPIFLEASAEIPDQLNNRLLSAPVLQKSEPLLPLPPNMQAAYISLWEQLRSS